MCIEQILKTPFVQDLFATLIGAFVGVLLAFMSNNRVARSARKRRELNLLRLLKETLENQQAVMEVIRDNPGRAWFPLPDPTVLESTSSVKYEVIDDLDLNRHLDLILFSLKAAFDLIQLWRQAGFRAAASDHPHSSDGLIRELAEALQFVVKNGIQDIGDTVRKIEKRIQELSNKD